MYPPVPRRASTARAGAGLSGSGLVCRNSAGPESPAAPRPSSFAPRLPFHPPRGIPKGEIAVPPFASFQEGSGRETQGSRRKPTKCGGELPRRSKRGPSGGLRWERAEQRKERAGALWAAARGMELVTTPPLPEFFFGGVEVYSFRMERIHLHRRRAVARLQPSRPPGRKSLCLRRRQSSHFTGWYSSPAPAPSQQRPLPSRPGPRWSSYRGDSW